MDRPRLLDLFCCEGGAGAGYAAAGWDVVGVDCGRRDRYPFTFHRGDALDYLAAHGAEFDAVHASPPCHAYSVTKYVRPADGPMLFDDVPTHPDLVGPTRAALIAAGRPWIMENVPGAPLDNPVMLCGTMFELGVTVKGQWRELRRHRLFESSVPLTAPGRCLHLSPGIGVWGNGGGDTDRKRRDTGRRGGYQANRAEARAVMQMPWASHYGATQAIPPAYTRWLGAQLMAAVVGATW